MTNAEVESRKAEPFVPGNRPLDYQSLPITSKQSLGEEYDIHNLNQLVATKAAYE